MEFKNRLESLQFDCGSRHGAAAVEFALVLPFLCVVLLGTVDFCRVFYCSVTVANCARNGALYGCADAAHAGDSAGIIAVCRADANNLKLSDLNVTVSSSTDGTGQSYVDVTVTYPFSTLTHYPGVPGTISISRKFRMSVLPATPVFN